MKKLLFMIGLGIVSTIFNNDATASVLGAGVKVTYDKGTKEWTADKTKTECVGKGVCKITIEVDVPLGVYDGGVAVGRIVMSDKGQLHLLFPQNILQDSYWTETFANNRLYIGKDIELDDSIKRSIKNCPTSIKAGSYFYQVNGDEVVVIVN